MKICSEQQAKPSCCQPRQRNSKCKREAGEEEQEEKSQGQTTSQKMAQEKLQRDADPHMKA
ncbi:hypothetical protein KDA_48260 [Dictyobacter alpinus]|uniref:Uncharacterized protein n=1 Tax=Dictyobacter alpinus TaxID=2014873 RepID=A0A402BDH3_9CHLR|nr:hypothetical protein KDA_48260 [Dictyobacter alpinus]